MPIINIAPSNYKINDNIQEQLNKHNTDKKAHQGMSFPANGGNADTVDGKHASDLQNYNNLTNKPSSLPANGGNADTVDGKHAADFVTDSPTGANNYTTVLAWALAQNQSAVAYSSADSNLSNAEDKPSNGQYGQFHYLLLKGESYRRTVIAFEYGATGYNIYRRSITVNAWYDNWVKINDRGNADTVDGYHAYQFQNIGIGGTPEATHLKSEYDNSKGRFYLKAYKDSGEYVNGVYVDYSADTEKFKNKEISQFISMENEINASNTDFNNILTSGFYNVSGNALLSSARHQPQNVYQYGVLLVANAQPYSKVQIYYSHSNEIWSRVAYGNADSFTNWVKTITSEMIFYSKSEPESISNGSIVMLSE